MLASNPAIFFSGRGNNCIRDTRTLDRHAGGFDIDMVIAQSKVTSQGKITVPAEVRRRLGLGLTLDMVRQLVVNLNKDDVKIEESVSVTAR